MQCSVVYANEAFFAGDRSHESVLKAMITERTILVEPKGIDPFEVRNCIHLVMSSNENWVIPASADARRYFLLNVSDKHMRDFEYFEKIITEMENGGRQALLHMLQHRDLSRFNVRNVPQTIALAEQKGYSRRGLDQLIEHLAHEGSLPAHHRLYPHIAITTGYEDGKGFHAIVRKLVDLRHTGPTALVRQLCADWGCKPYRSGGLNGIEFPSLKEFRASFDARHGPQEWPAGTDWEFAGTVYGP
jgi:hypothetical protein